MDDSGYLKMWNITACKVIFICLFIYLFCLKTSLTMLISLEWLSLSLSLSLFLSHLLSAYLCILDFLKFFFFNHFITQRKRKEKKGRKKENNNKNAWPLMIVKNYYVIWLCFSFFYISQGDLVLFCVPYLSFSDVT